MQTINWYPGHMAKAKRELAESLKRVDMVIELLDARIPRASRNPDLDALGANKLRLCVLTKSDLADPAATQRWIARLRESGLEAIDCVGVRAGQAKKALALIERSTRARIESLLRDKGIKKTVRAMVVGVPNVGKSTFINLLAGGAVARAADRPGVTRGRQWIRITPYLELLDTPGLLWPKLQDQRDAHHLAYVGTIRDDILNIEQLAASLLKELADICPQPLAARFKLTDLEAGGDELLAQACRGRGWLRAGGVEDLERAARVVLSEFRDGKLGPITLESPEEAQHG